MVQQIQVPLPFCKRWMRLFTVGKVHMSGHIERRPYLPPVLPAARRSPNFLAAHAALRLAASGRTPPWSASSPAPARSHGKTARIPAAGSAAGSDAPSAAASPSGREDIIFRLADQGLSSWRLRSLASLSV